MKNRIALIGLALVFAGFITCKSQTYQSGERIYKKTCANCHMDHGEGLGALIPPLAGSDYLAQHRDNLPCIVRYGLEDTIYVKGKMYGEKMYGLPDLSEIQITNILNYVNSSWGNNNPPYTYEDVTTLLAKCRR